MTELWSLRDTAATLGWPADRIRRLVKTGKMPAVRINNRYFFRPAEIDAWIEAHAVRTVTATVEPETFTTDAGVFAGRFQ